jgi:AraC-like DNA-binding protein
VVPRLLSAEDGLVAAHADQSRAVTIFPCAEQEFVQCADDMLLVRTNTDATQLSYGRDATWEIDTRGWLYLHFRLAGTSLDRLATGIAQTVSGGSFLACVSSSPQALSRQVLTDDWRAVTVAFRPSYAFHNLPFDEACLLSELRQFRAGRSDVDFFYVNQFTPDMHAAVRALLVPSVTSGLREFYLRAKAVELVCLALDQMGRPAARAESPLKLSHRDVRALGEAKRLVEKEQNHHSLDELARRVGLNRRKLALGFKALFGATVGEYQREIRLELARRILEARTASVAYAATVAGYSDVGSFGKAFKARYGHLPSQSRRAAVRRK